MTVLATWLDISINLLLFAFVCICLLMSVIILMQRPKNEGLGAAFGSGTTDQLFGARTSNVLQKATVYLATLFFVITLALAVMIGKQNAANRKSLVAEVVPPAPAVTETTTTPADAKPLEPEAVTPAVEIPAAPVETPAPAETPAPPETPAPEETPAPAENASTPAEPAETPAEPATPAEDKAPEQP